MRAQIFNNNGVIKSVKVLCGRESAFIAINLAGTDELPINYTLLSNSYPDYRVIVVKPKAKTLAEKEADREFDHSWFTNKEKHASLRKQMRYPEIILFPETDEEKTILTSGSFHAFDLGFGQINYYLLSLSIDNQKLVWEDIEAPSSQELENWV